MLDLEDKMCKKDEEFEEMNKRNAMELEKFMEEVKGKLAETEPI